MYGPSKPEKSALNLVVVWQKYCIITHFNMPLLVSMVDYSSRNIILPKVLIVYALQITVDTQYKYSWIVKLAIM